MSYTPHQNLKEHWECRLEYMVCRLARTPTLIKIPLVTTVPYMVIYYDLTLHFGLFRHCKVYLNTKNIRKKDNCEHKIF